MRKRYDLERSDNYMVSNRVSLVISESDGTVKFVTGFPVKSATVSFATIPCQTVNNYSSSSSSGGGGDETSDLPRIYVSSYESDGFVVTYEGMPEGIGYIEFNYAAV